MNMLERAAAVKRTKEAEKAEKAEAEKRRAEDRKKAAAAAAAAGGAGSVALVLSNTFGSLVGQPCITEPAAGEVTPGPTPVAKRTNRSHGQEVEGSSDDRDMGRTDEAGSAATPTPTELKLMAEIERLTLQLAEMQRFMEKVSSQADAASSKADAASNKAEIASNTSGRTREDTATLRTSLKDIQATVTSLSTLSKAAQKQIPKGTAQPRVAVPGQEYTDPNPAKQNGSSGGAPPPPPNSSSAPTPSPTPQDTAPTSAPHHSAGLSIRPFRMIAPSCLLLKRGEGSTMTVQEATGIILEGLGDKKPFGWRITEQSPKPPQGNKSGEMPTAAQPSILERMRAKLEKMRSPDVDMATAAANPSPSATAPAAPASPATAPLASPATATAASSASATASTAKTELPPLLLLRCWRSREWEFWRIAKELKVLGLVLAEDLTPEQRVWKRDQKDQADIAWKSGNMVSWRRGELVVKQKESGEPWARWADVAARGARPSAWMPNNSFESNGAGMK